MELPITAMLEEEEKSINTSPRVIAFLDDMIPRIRTMEKAQQKKAKEEERERTIQQVVGILEEMKANSFHKDARDKLQEAITRIKFNT